MAASLLPNLSPKNYSSTDLEYSNIHGLKYSKDMSEQRNDPQVNKEELICDETKIDENNDSSVSDIKDNTLMIKISPNSSDRNLRKRKINLNALSSNLTCPKVCQFTNCGIQLPTEDALEWHYEGHFSHELEKLEKIKVKRPSTLKVINSDNLVLRRPLRNSAVDRIKFNREKRLARKAINRNNIQNTSNVQQNSLSGEDIDEGGVVEPALSSSLPKCPVCELEFDYVDLTEHIDICLRTYETNLEDNNESFSTEEDNDVDVDATDGLETYTWAGQTRIRSSSLIEGGLRGAGFLTITRGDEDQVLDIENDDIRGAEAGLGPTQYTDADVLVPESEIGTKEDDERITLTQILLGADSMKQEKCKVEKGNEGTTSNECKDTLYIDFESSSIAKLKNNRIAELKRENKSLRQSALCNICLTTYVTPVVSTACWHVHCEQCWLRALGAKKLCPQCKIIVQPKDLRKIYL